MSRRRTLAVAAALAGLLPAPPVPAQNGACAGLTGAPGDGLKALACVAEQARLIADLSDRVAQLEARAPAVPGGAVLAFDRRGGCPEGWSRFAEAEGRFVLGAGDGGAFFRQRGGEETVTLTVAQMPEHDHEILRADGQPITVTTRRLLQGGADIELLDGRGETRLDYRTSPAGAAEPHNNMPPYIALHLCRKD